MLNLNQLIPKDKFDIEAVEKLNDYSIEELKPIVPALLEWLQDGHWPVSYPIRLYLEKYVKDIQDEILEIFNTDDTEWKHYILSFFGNEINSERLISEIKRIATHPTDLEKTDELDEMAKELMIEKGW